MADGPAVVGPYSSESVELGVKDATAIPANARGFLGVGYDGTNTVFVRVNSSGQQIIVGAGVAGTPAGGVLSIQGVSGGQALPVSGTFWQATQPISAVSLPLPTGAATEATLASIKDTDGVKKITDPLPAGTNEIGKVAQGAAAVATAPWSIRASDGSAFINVALEHVTAASPHATRLSDGSAFYDATKTGQLPSALVGGRLDTNLGAWLGSTAPTVGQKTMVDSVPIAISSDQSAIPVSQSGTWTVQQGTPPWAVKGTDAHGAPPTQNPVLVGGSDGTNVFRLLVDASGRLQVVALTGSTSQVEGRAADGVPPVGNPVLMGGQDGTNVQSLLTDTQGRLEVAPSGANSTVKGFSDGNIVLASTTITAIRSTTYTEPSSGAQRSVASSSANDTSAGTGARTLRITYYTLNAGTVAGPFTEDVTLNGTTAVNTVATNICFIEKLVVLTVGSGGVNAGTITLYGSTAGGGGTVWTIAIGINKTFGAHHYVPSGMTANITGFLGGIKGADTSGFILRSKNPADANAAENQISDLLRAPSSGSTPLRIYGTPIEVEGPARITAYAVPDSTSSRTYYASFDYYEQ